MPCLSHYKWGLKTPPFRYFLADHLNLGLLQMQTRLVQFSPPKLLTQTIELHPEEPSANKTSMWKHSTCCLHRLWLVWVMLLLHACRLHVLMLSLTQTKPAGPLLSPERRRFLSHHTTTPPPHPPLTSKWFVSLWPSGAKQIASCELKLPAEKRFNETRCRSNTSARRFSQLAS